MPYTISSLQPSLVFHGVMKTDATDSNPDSPRVCELAPSPNNRHSVHLEGHMELRILPKSPYLFVRVPEEFTGYWKPAFLSFTSSSRVQTIHALAGNAVGYYRTGGKGQMYEFSMQSPGREWIAGSMFHIEIFVKLQFERTVPMDIRELAETAIPTPRPYRSLSGDIDVALIFPFEKPSCPSVLWACKAKLMALSSYFEAMFTGGFLESDNILVETSQILEAARKDVLKVKVEERRKGRPSDITPGDFDADDDGSMEQNDDQAEQETEAAAASASIHYIAIRDTSYRTYQGLLDWAYSGQIEYAALKSTHPSESSSKPSPKSIFRLAHQLGIKALQNDAVANFQSQLTHKNVLEELFSSTCFAYPELRDAGLKVLEREWGKVKEAGGLDGIFKLLGSEQGESKEMTRMALEILKRSQSLGS